MENPLESSPLLRHGPFQKLFWAHVVSLIGSGLSSVALGLLAHQLVGASAASVLGVTLAIRIAVIVFCAPLAGRVADYVGAQRAMIWCDVLRAGVIAGFFFVDSVWQIYGLAVLLNLGSALFTPIYKATIPVVVSSSQYPRALALGAIAYDMANILGPSLAGLVIAAVGFRGNFVVDAISFIVSAGLLVLLPRHLLQAPKRDRPQPALSYGLATMFRRPTLRLSLLLALQVSVMGAFVLVATVDFIKVRLGLSDTAYAWAMAAYGIGAVAAAAGYSRSSPSSRDTFVSLCAPAMLLALILAASFQKYAPLLVGWSFAGAAQSILGIRGNEYLAAASEGEERPHIFAAHFSLSHAGWGATYPLAGFLTTWLGFGNAAWIFAALLLAISIPIWWHKHRTVTNKCVYRCL